MECVLSSIDWHRSMPLYWNYVSQYSSEIVATKRICKEDRPQLLLESAHTMCERYQANNTFDPAPNEASDNVIRTFERGTYPLLTYCLRTTEIRSKSAMCYAILTRKKNTY